MATPLNLSPIKSMPSEKTPPITAKALVDDEKVKLFKNSSLSPSVISLSCLMASPSISTYLS